MPSCTFHGCERAQAAKVKDGGLNSCSWSVTVTLRDCRKVLEAQRVKAVLVWSGERMLVNFASQPFTCIGGLLLIEGCGPGLRGLDKICDPNLVRLARTMK